MFLKENLDQVFDLERVQRVIDEDLGRRVGRERELYERFHRRNLRFLSRLYANNLYRLIVVGQTLSQDTMGVALRELKSASSCEYYPCTRT